MNDEPSTPLEGKSAEIFQLVRQLQETDQRLQELAGGELDVVLFPTGTSFLLRKTQEDLLRSEAVQRRLADTQRAILNALPANIALLDGEGKILSVNEGWRAFAGANALQDKAAGVGQNYLEICEQARNDRAEEARKVAAGIRSVLSGEKQSFELEYPCHSPGEERWFRLLVSPLHETRTAGAVVMHLNITERKRMEAAIHAVETRRLLLFENMVEGYAYCRAVYDGDRMVDVIFIEVNGAFEAQTGLKNVVGRKVSEIIPKIWETNPALLGKYARVISTGKPDRYESYVKTLAKWFSVTIYSYEKDHFVGVFDNITQRKCAEESLAATSALLETLLENTSDHIYFKDLQSRFVHFSFEMLKLFRLKHPGELKGRTDFDFFTEEHARPAFEVEQEIIRTGRPVLNLEERTTHFDGRIEWVLTSKMPWRDKAGNIIGTMGISRDITARKRAEEALRQSEARFRGVFTATATGIATSTPDGHFLQANAAYCRMLGYTEDELRGLDFVSLTHPEDLPLNLKLRDEILAGLRDSFVMEKRYLKKGGDIVWVSHSVSPIRAAGGQVTAFITVAENISERKEAQDAIRLFRTLVDQSNDMIAVFDIETDRFLDVNDSACAKLGYTREELLSLRLPEIDLDFSEASQEKHRKDLQRAGVVTFESRHRRKDGTVFPVEVSLKRADLGKSYIVAVVRDITERKRLELRFRRLVDSNAQAVFFWNVKGGIMDCNEAFLKLVGYTCEDLKAGQINWAAMTPPEYAEQDQRALKEVTTTGIGPTYEKEYIRKDGSRVSVLVGSATFEDNPDEGVAFVFDLTERKKLEMQFRQSQKMESIGHLASGVAHDFNNILAVIQIQSDLLASDNTLSAEQLEFVRTIGRASQSAANLTRQLLLFSRKQAMQPRELDLSETISSMTKILARSLGENIEIQFKFAMQSLFIHADPGMMDQVLLNLAVNARDAMPKGGRLVIETSAVEFDETTPAQSAQIRHGKFICLAVSDTGTGIAPENLSKIFDPFFTTKEVGKGTGLGLATVFGIVQQHQGWINVYSEVGKGTTFRIYLPRLSKTSEGKTAPPTTEYGRGGNETILLVEDQSSLRTSVQTALSRLGYRVLDAINGIEALEIWKQHRDEIKLVLTDMVMPGGINGMQLGEQLLRDNPKLKIIYASGYSSEIVDKNFPLKEGVNFLAKPFEMHKLAKTIRDNLDKVSS